ncbi:MAG: putative immunity protein [Burkholderiales bacterium]
MFSDVDNNIKKKNKLLFTRDSMCLKELIALIEMQSHRTLVMWALDCAKNALEVFESLYPDEQRLRRALELCEEWSKGRIKMPEAKRAILDAHQAAKDYDDEYGALAHAIGHACAAVHVETHAIGLVLYELTAIVRRYGKNKYQKPVSEKIDYYKRRLVYWQENAGRLRSEWAGFLSDDARFNRERALNERRKRKRQGV